MTVRTALAELQRQGLIEKRNGVGSFLTKRAERRSGLIGLIIPDYHSIEFFAEFKTELEQLAKRLNYRITLVTTDAIEPEESILQIRRQARELAVARVEGVVFRPFISEHFAKTNLEVVQIFQRTETPIVLIDSDVTPDPGRSDCDLVGVNNIECGRLIATHLLSRGYKRINFLMGPKSFGRNPNWGRRLFGLAGELALRGHEESVHMLRIDPSDIAAVASALKSRRPDAIVCGNDENAAKLIRSLTELGRHIPEDVAVVGFDDIACARMSVPSITTISQPVKKLAVTAFKTLLARIRYPKNDPKEINLSAPLVVRSST